ncbi:hypothetical protein BJY27_001660 [Streptomyces rapamycinicus]|uniref:Uncharacterized protein n=2 Tax=Streptomyces rapamycinicus TaxID=1226757 RepID=A0A3L8R509_STRRN|nr:hypothetical protein [Streptomyces rapamycinicus]RLV74650.1 hypothetical protein D3C57_135530 [Streptomyces rapamycinicus NRRL 5491]
MRTPCEYRKLADGKFTEFQPCDTGEELDLDSDGDVRAYS